MADNPHPQYRQDRCEHCRAGMPLYVEEPGYHIAQNDESGPIKCQAPTPEAYIAELDGALAEMKGALVTVCEMLDSVDARRTTYAAERDQAQAAAKIATAALKKIVSNDDSEVPDQPECDCSYCAARAALSTEAVAAELARQKAQTDELASLRQQLADADRINAGVVRGRT